MCLICSQYSKTQTQKPSCILILPLSMMKIGYTAQLIVAFTCSQYKGSDRIFSILIEYGNYCCLLLLSCMSLRSIARRISLRQLSLRSIPSSFTMNLGRVKVRIGQMDRHDGLRTKHTCRPRIKHPSTDLVRVGAHEWKPIITLFIK